MNLIDTYNKNKYKFWLSILILSIVYAILSSFFEDKKNQSASYAKIKGRIINVIGTEEPILGRDILVITLDDKRKYRLPYGEVPILEKNDIIELNINTSDFANNEDIIYAKSYKLLKRANIVNIEIIEK